jgi:hypothetical protein
LVWLFFFIKTEPNQKWSPLLQNIEVDLIFYIYTY